MRVPTAGRVCVSRVFLLAPALFGTLALGTGVAAQSSPWVRPLKPGDPLIWGRRDGAVFGLPSPGGIKGPRGLIRIGFYPASNSAQPELLNFFAVEPIVQGPGRRFDRLGFSELEMSQADPGQRGKRLLVHPSPPTAGAPESARPDAGTLETLQVGNVSLERLTVRIDVERFSLTGAHVYLLLSMESDLPGEIRVSGFAEPDSPPLDELTITATMGNFERLRLLWLKDRVEDSRELFGDYSGNAFVEGRSYQLGELLRTREGDAIVFCTTDEASPRDTPGNATAHWPFPLPRRTQYWRVPGVNVEPNLRARVNARRVYWNSTSPVLGGIAFENFEMRERFMPGQTFIFGITPQEPWSFLHELEQYQGPGVAHPNTHPETP